MINSDRISKIFENTKITNPQGFLTADTKFYINIEHIIYILIVLLINSKIVNIEKHAIKLFFWKNFVAILIFYITSF
jgi:hypothetical protein